MHGPTLPGRLVRLEEIQGAHKLFGKGGGELVEQTSLWCCLCLAV